jgi:hypothetical protein
LPQALDGLAPAEADFCSCIHAPSPHTVSPHLPAEQLDIVSVENDASRTEKLPVIGNDGPVVLLLEDVDKAVPPFVAPEGLDAQRM